MFFVYIFMYAGVSLTLACNHRREHGCNPWILLSPSCTLSAPDPTRWLLCGSSTMRSLKVGPSPNIIQEVLTCVTTMRFTKTTTTTICFLGDGVENMNTFTSMLCAGLILRPPPQQQQSGKTTLMRWHKLCSSLPSHDLFFVGFRKCGGGNKKDLVLLCCISCWIAIKATAGMNWISLQRNQGCVPALQLLEVTVICFPGHRGCKQKCLFFPPKGDRRNHSYLY